LAHPQELLERARVEVEVALRRLETAEAAERERFFGSPTVRVVAEHVERGAERRTDFGMKWPVPTRDGLRRKPADEWVVDAAARADARVTG
jgi:hypothetical protein